MVVVRVGHRLVDPVQLLLGVNLLLVLRLVSGISQAIGSFFGSVVASPSGVEEDEIPDDNLRFAIFLIRYGTFT